jgi:hypothetical protein
MKWHGAVEAYYMGLEHGLKFDGIGFILVSDSDLVVIDLDNAFDADGNIKQIAKEILDYFSSYAEISPSGKGIHIWLKAKIIGSNLPQIFAENQSVEVFTHDHHITVTGDVVTGYEILRECQAEAENFYCAYKTKNDAASRKVTEPARGDSMDDRMQRYVEAAMESEVESVRSEHEGNRNTRLNQAAFTLGRLVGGGYLSEIEVERALLNAAKHAGISEEEARATIQSGLEAGKKDPRDIVEGISTSVKAKSGQVLQNQAVEDSELQCMVRYDPESIDQYGVDLDGVIYSNSMPKSDLNKKPEDQIILKTKACDGYARIKAQAWNEKGESTFTIQGRGSKDNHRFEFEITAKSLTQNKIDNFIL